MNTIAETFPPGEFLREELEARGALPDAPEGDAGPPAAAPEADDE